MKNSKTKEQRKTNWEYYNHAYILREVPHSESDLKEVYSKEFWRKHNRSESVLARWVENFDCDEETEWWHTILDKPFDLMQLKSKRRCVVAQGLKNFDIKEIEFADYIEQIAQVQEKAFEKYPKKYRPNFSKDAWISGNHSEEEKLKFYGAFDRNNGEMCAYLSTKQFGNCIFLIQLKANPEYEKLQVNAGILAKFLKDQNDFIAGGGYISNGERNILHETAFNSFLEKYFFFRKAYCDLHIKYKKRIKIIINFLYPLKKLLLKFDGIGIVHKLNGLLKMEEIIRKQQKRKRNESLIELN